MQEQIRSRKLRANLSITDPVKGRRGSSSYYYSSSCFSSCFSASSAVYIKIRILMRDIVGGPYHPPLWRWHSTEARQAVMTSQFTAIVWCMHGQRAVEQRPRIAAVRGVSDTVSHWRTRTARNHLPAGPGCQRRSVYGQGKGEKAMTNVIRGSVGGPYHPPFWRCHSLLSTEAKQAIVAGNGRYAR